MTFFFDIDDTLYDRGLPFYAAVKEFFDDFSANPREAYVNCTARGNDVFLPSQRGEISMDEMNIYRWCRGFEGVGIVISPQQALDFQSLYRRMQDNITLSPVMEKMLGYCAGHTDSIGILTNGPSDKQWNKIARLGLERFFRRDMIVVSGDLGIDKPDKAIFDIAGSISGELPDELFYVGDSLMNDIYPAAACGWRTLWFNRYKSPVPENIKTEAIANTEEELADIVMSLI